MNKLLFIVLFASVYILLACSDDVANSDNDEVGNYISCTINGDKWHSDGTYFGLELGPYRKQLRILGFNSTDTIEFVLKFFAFDSIKAGTYEFGVEKEKFAIYHHNSQSDTSYSGKIIFDIVDENYPVKAKGTFSFEINSSDDSIYKFQNGKFDSGNN